MRENHSLLTSQQNKGCLPAWSFMALSLRLVSSTCTLVGLEEREEDERKKSWEYFRLFRTIVRHSNKESVSSLIETRSHR